MRALAPIRTVLKTSERRKAKPTDATRRDGPSDRARRLPSLANQCPRQTCLANLSPSARAGLVVFSVKKRGLSTANVEKYRAFSTLGGHGSIHFSNDKRLILSRFPSIMIMKYRRFRSFLSIFRLAETRSNSRDSTPTAGKQLQSCGQGLFRPSCI